MSNENTIKVFIQRLEKLNIKLELGVNFPWIYIFKINDKVVTETFESEHGFTLCTLSMRRDDKFEFSNITEIFKLLRKYTKDE